MTRLSVNINKVALIRNARGGAKPDLKQIALDLEKFGAQGITVHPRPDQRHIRYDDVRELYPVLSTEFNIEGNPDKKWLEIVKEAKPAQATLVPDDPDQLTSDHGWDTIANESFLKDTIQELKESGCRVALFIDPIEQFIERAKKVGADRVELYTGPYAKIFSSDKQKAIQPFIQAAKFAKDIGLDLNAGHDLDLINLRYFKEHIPGLDEVSIGHALISDSLYFGLEKTVGMYLKELKE
ncbi:MAG: pyridoxine 5'-phosphate synthase [Bacteroidetes bacterium]|nr:pyridoxine 5'-phosphate synthase [Bacteroidota bacterium]